MTLNSKQTSDYCLILNDQDLNAHCNIWQHKPFLAIDTEFMRTDTFYPKLALLQINDGEQNYLIDPLLIEDWESFKRVMLAESVVKIFHSCSEDLLVFVHRFQLLPAPVFDTQIANAFLNQGFALSYQNLVAEHTGYELPKGETRSDWLQRPLSEDQLHYAALDVEFLPQIYQYQIAELQQQGRLAWVKEDCQRLLGNYQDEMAQNFSQAYTNMSAAWKLDEKQLTVLQSLAEWREQRARQRDKPKNWIVRDDVLLALAKLCPTERQALESMDKLNDKFIHYEGDAVLQLIAQALKVENPLPNNLPQPLSGSQKKLFKKTQSLVQQKAENLSLPVEVLGRKRLLLGLFHALNSQQEQSAEGKINADTLRIPEELQGWRRAILLPAILEFWQ